MCYYRRNIIVNKSFNEILQDKRKEKKIKIKQLSEMSGITCAQIRNLESGKCKPNAVTVAKLAKALEYDFE